jgi:hypothetical protein
MLKAIGDHNPSQFLRHLSSVTPDVPYNFLHSILSSRLPPIYRPLSLASRRATWTPQPAVQTTSSRPHSSRRSRALRHSPTATHFYSGPRTSPTRWQHSELSDPTLTPAPGIPAPTPGTVASAADPPPEMTQHPYFAGTTAAMELGRKTVLSPVPTASRED